MTTPDPALAVPSEALDSEVPVVTREALARRLYDPSLTVLNVLSREAFAQGHIPGSMNLPVDEIPGRAREILPDRTREFIVHCGSFT